MKIEKNRISNNGEAIEIETIVNTFSKLFDIIYPIGCLYWSSQNKNPKDLFGIGNWKQITDCFIYAYNENNDIIQGNNSITLTSSQIPSHSHSTNWQSTTASLDGGIDHTHTRGTMNITGQIGIVSDKTPATGAFSRNGAWANASLGTGYSGYSTIMNASDSWEGETSSASAYLHNHNISHTHTTDSVYGNENGGTDPFNNMPRYIQKFCWERIS